ncbi:hypothetical protein [Azospirillum palustre]|uniref:hypothetical protein n=1 Tax=Azospirillum palustre TaxID=2044885 RepID=UPI0011788507|nr:hypothetical protein [Azospirillum palustre]
MLFSETLRFRLCGVAPLLMRNSRLVDPLDDYSREISAIAGKRHKTISDHERLAQVEWHGSVWVDDGRPCIPAHVIEGMIAAAARTRKRGGHARSGLICTANAPLVYEGPSTLDDLWKDPRFQLRMPVRTPKGRVMRTRPAFPNWQAIIEIKFLPSVVDTNSVEEWLKLGGDLLGIGDFRPRYGRFSVEAVANTEIVSSDPAGRVLACQASARQGSAISEGEVPVTSPSCRPQVKNTKALPEHVQQKETTPQEQS